MFLAKAEKIILCVLVHPRIETMGDDVIVGAEVVVTFIHITFQQIKVRDAQLVDVGLAYAHLGGGNFDASESRLWIEQGLGN